MLDRTRETSKRLLRFRENCQQAQVRRGIDPLASFAFAVDRSTSDREVIDEVLRHHQRVQSGKIDGGVPKRDWVAYDAVAASLLRPSPRFQLTERPPVPDGDRLTHPYRLEAFIYMLGENHVIPYEQRARATQSGA